MNIARLPWAHLPTVTPQKALTYWERCTANSKTNYSRPEVRTILNAYAIQAAHPWCFTVAVAQLWHETGFLSSWWSQRPRRNPAGIGVNGRVVNEPTPPSKAGLPTSAQRPDGRWAMGLSFPRWVAGSDQESGAVRHHLVRLGWITGVEYSPALLHITQLERGLSPQLRASASCLIELGSAYNPTGKGWAHPGKDPKMSNEQAEAEGRTYGHALGRHIMAMVAS